MISIGNFFFKYRNRLFIFLYLSLFIPSPGIFTASFFGDTYYLWSLVTGLIITVSGQAIRAATIGLAYIIRGGRNGNVYAESLVTNGIFRHCRNPLYVGNILMLAGAGIMANSLFFLTIFVPLFLFIYNAIVLAEEEFLRNKFGNVFNDYCVKVNRWIPDFRGLLNTFRAMHFNWRRWLLKEYNTQYVWLSGLVLITLFIYPQVTGYDTDLRDRMTLVAIFVFTIYYGVIRFLKKTGRMVE